MTTRRDACCGWLAAATLLGCGGETVVLDWTPTTDATQATCPLTPAAEKPDASCDVTIERPPVMATSHVPENSQIEYCSNPPSSGPHYPVWAAFKEYSTPIAWPYLVHSMEHGGVVLLYNCDPACPDVVDGLRRVRDSLEPDPLCDADTPRRIILAPSSAITQRVAAAAWGATYEASCVDPPSLEAFVRDHYAKGPENECTPGRVF